MTIRRNPYQTLTVARTIRRNPYQTQTVALMTIRRNPYQTQTVTIMTIRRNPYQTQTVAIMTIRRNRTKRRQSPRRFAAVRTKLSQSPDRFAGVCADVKLQTETSLNFRLHGNVALGRAPLGSAKGLSYMGRG